MGKGPAVLDLVIGSLAPGGEGVAHAEVDGQRRAVFAPHTAPGDLARLEVDLSHRPARSRVITILRAGPDRVAPPCPVQARCGGCDWMHLSPEAQSDWHAALVRAGLPAQWRATPIAVHRDESPPAPRVRARVHVRAESNRARVGMFETRTHDPVEVDLCAVLDPALEGARRALPSLFSGSRGRGDVLLALGKGRRPVLDANFRGEIAPALFARLERAEGEGGIAGARVLPHGATRPAVVGDPTPWMVGPDGAPLRLAPGGFAQANERVNARLAAHVLESVLGARLSESVLGARLSESVPSGEARPERVVELYAGAGNLSVLLAPHVGELSLVESDRDACEAARANLAARALSARVVEADANAYEIGAGTRIVVLDPPRSGARAVVERLVGSRVWRIVYVSCDPQTLGRDLGVLAASYDLRSIATFEMFPHTSHVEAVATLDRKGR
jgi:23S rRNA (uracil1939-C5)-methyltransferase